MQFILALRNYLHFEWIGIVTQQRSRLLDRSGLLALRLHAVEESIDFNLGHLAQPQMSQSRQDEMVEESSVPQVRVVCERRAMSIF